MKKLLLLMLCIALVLSVVACSETSKTPETSQPTTEAPTEKSPFTFDYFTYTEEGMFQSVTPTEDMFFVQTLLNGLPVDLIPHDYSIVAVTPDFFEYDVFTTYVDGMTAVRCEPTYYVHFPFSIVLLNVPDGTDVEAICADIEANVNPRKWICVEAEAVRVVANGNTVLLVMSSEDIVETVVANFSTTASELME